MQLKPARMGRIGPALGLLTANLFAATGVHAQDVAPPSYSSSAPSVVDDTETDLGLTRVDSAVLFYQEAGGRVKATEPVVSVNLNGTNGDILSMKLTADSLTGATPNGAAPWKLQQTFITPSQPPGSTHTVTSASGKSSLVTIPGTGTIARQYTTDPHLLPVDAGFRDRRYAVDLGYSTLLNPDTRLSFGGSGSTERDYTSVSGNLGLSRDLNQKNTTLGLAVNLEFDRSRPFFGTPTPLTPMSAEAKGPDTNKIVASLVAGVTQVISRRWLVQLNYSLGTTNGNQTDPYRIISQVDPLTGGPLQYLYESRPRSRLRQSVYFGNKISIGPTVLDASARLYKDSWGLKSVTVEGSERVPLTSWLYIEPKARYYRQNAANFFHDYLIGGQPLPEFASSDGRLGKFSAVTLGLKLGLKVGDYSEFYIQGDRYRQTGDSHPAGAVGALANENLFTGIKATSVIFGYSFAFE